MRVGGVSEGWYECWYEGWYEGRPTVGMRPCYAVLYIEIMYNAFFK